MIAASKQIPPFTCSDFLKVRTDVGTRTRVIIEHPRLEDGSGYNMAMLRGIFLPPGIEGGITEDKFKLIDDQENRLLFSNRSFKKWYSTGFIICFEVTIQQYSNDEGIPISCILTIDSWNDLTDTPTFFGKKTETAIKTKEWKGVFGFSKPGPSGPEAYTPECLILEYYRKIFSFGALEIPWELASDYLWSIEDSKFYHSNSATPANSPQQVNYQSSSPGILGSLYKASVNAADKNMNNMEVYHGGGNQPSRNSYTYTCVGVSCGLSETYNRVDASKKCSRCGKPMNRN